MPEHKGDSVEHAGSQATTGDTLRFNLARLAVPACSWLALLVILIIIADRTPVTGPAGMSLPRATFFVLNAASLTGFETTWAAPERLTTTHAVIALISVTATALLSISIATAALVRVSGLSLAWRRVLLSSLGFLVTLVCVAFAADLAARTGLRASAWNSLMIATGTGLLIDGRSDSVLWWGYFPVAAVAAIGPFVLWETLRRGPLSSVSRLTWLAVPASFLTAIGLVCGTQALSLTPLETDSEISAQEVLVPAATAAVDARGAGFTNEALQLSHAARWALVPVLLVGGASGGIGGGLKAVTVAVLVVGLARLLQGGGVGRTFAMAAIWLLALAVLFGVAFVLLIHFSPQLRADRAAILAAAACGNTGVSIDPVGATGADAYVLAGAMLLGRALPWLLLWWSANRGDEPVAIG